MVDALPYLANYPYGCTEQTLNRFLPTVITQNILLDMGLNLEDIRSKRANLNAQGLGDPVERAKQWQQWDRNPVFDPNEVRDMAKAGVKRLTAMQLSDGGWGWFSGWGEHSYPHTTAVVVHGLQIAKANDVAVVPGVIERGVQWLKAYQDKQVTWLRNAEQKKKDHPWKQRADNLDALVYMVLQDAGVQDPAMRDYLYRDRTHLSVYAKAVYGIALHKQGHTEKLDMIKRNIEQYLVLDNENQTAYLRLPNNGYWWYWYGSEIEAHAYYLKLLALTEPKSEKASGLVKYLLNNRKHATYWDSTRDTALCIEAMADYLRATGEMKPNLTLNILVDGDRRKEVTITADNLFAYDDRFVMRGDAVETGEHTVQIKKTGKGPLYYNAYLRYFTLEDFITKAGLEIKVDRIVYKLTEVEDSTKVAGSRGQALDQKVQKYEREKLDNLATLKSGDLVEVELIVESKNDYEYIVIEDMKAAGFEPVEVRSGYTHNGLGAYQELRDEKVAFFVRSLPRGQHSLTYRLRAEIPGRFSALPAKAYGMYAPELKANSDEIKLNIED
ncbi:MAG: alpha-2-macroglobulin, partial [Candidatus Pacebacteria bacterium]|nr:alpha-2-macroglobulin [Candidatus Paceibacterota bacterium]